MLSLSRAPRYCGHVNSPGPHLAQLLLAAYRRMVDDAMGELETRGYHDVRPVFHYALMAIDGGAGSASDLGRALSVSKQAAARTVRTLEERGWVGREADASDHRRKHLQVTGAGHRVLDEGASVFDDLRRAWSEEIGEHNLRRLEQQLAEFVGESEGRPRTGVQG